MKKTKNGSGLRWHSIPDTRQGLRIKILRYLKDLRTRERHANHWIANEFGDIIGRYNRAALPPLKHSITVHNAAQLHHFLKPDDGFPPLNLPRACDVPQLQLSTPMFAHIKKRYEVELFYSCKREIRNYEYYEKEFTERGLTPIHPVVAAALNKKTKGLWVSHQNVVCWKDEKDEHRLFFDYNGDWLSWNLFTSKRESHRENLLSEMNLSNYMLIGIRSEKLIDRHR